MTYKTFSFRSAHEGWSNVNGNTTTLIGGIYNYKVAETFRKIKFIQLVEQADNKSQIKDDTWVIQADADLQRECRQLSSKHEHYFQRPELIIKGRGKNIDTMFAYMGSSGD